MDVQIGTLVPSQLWGKSFNWAIVPDDAYAAGLVIGPIPNPSARGARLLLFVDNVTTGNGAAATAVLTGDAVSGSTDLVGGEGYNTAPDIEVTGDGTGATAHAVLTSNAVSSIVIDTGGSAYTHAEFVFTGGGTLGTIKVAFEIAEQASDSRYTLLESATINTTGAADRTYTVYPGMTALNNRVANNHVGDEFYVRFTHSAAGIWRYNAMLQLLT